MTIKVFSVLSLMFVSLFNFSQSTIEGNWENEENGFVIDVYNENNMFFGKILTVPNEDDKDKVGHLVLNELVYNSSTKKYEGVVKTTLGISAHGEIELLNENRFRLTVTKLFFHKTQTFVRVK